MGIINIKELIKKLSLLKLSNMYLKDFFNTWDKNDDELKGILITAEILESMRVNNISSKLYDSGLAISIFRDQSTRTRFSFSSACNLLGLEVQDFDESKSQVAHGELVRETANMISFMAEVVGIRDDMYIGKGEAYMKDVSTALQEGYKSGVLPERPTIINLQSDIDHPTQSMSDLLHLINYFGGIEKLSGKKLAMTWAYSPAYGKPLSVPQSIIGLLSRFGMDITLAHPKGYEIIPEVIKIAERNTINGGGSFKIVDDMENAFNGADIVYPKSWAPFKAMQERTKLYENGDKQSIDRLEKELLKQNADFKHWSCTEELLAKTKNGNALYMHCLPADISTLSCEQGEVDSAIFERYKWSLYKEASYKAYVIAAMILLSRVQNSADLLDVLLEKGKKRVNY